MAIFRGVTTLRAVRLLVVDDDSEVRDLLERALVRDGHVVVVAATAQAARAAIEAQPPDVVVLDLSLPDGDGIALCRELRSSRSEIPVLMLTAHSEVATRVRSLDAGADDFLGKPFAVAELRARVRALGRRRLGGSTPASIHRDGVSIDLAARRATRDDRVVSLTAREWDVLGMLARRNGRVVTRATLLEEVWGDSTPAAAASLEVMVARIRRKLGEGLIRTLRREGYALEVH